MRKVRLRAAGVLAAGVLALAGCSGPYGEYLTGGSMEQKQEMKTLFRLLQNEKEPGENRFVLMQQVANRLAGISSPEQLILFLTTYVEKNPTDPYNAYYLGLVAETYRDMGAYPLAIHYYNRVLLNHPDLLVSDSSIHLRCLQELIKLVDDPRDRIGYYKELIARFSSEIDPGVTNYYLGRTYGEVGDWEQAIQVYQKFLGYPDVDIAGVPNAHQRIRELVDFYYSDKKWTVDSLPYLVAQIKEAIQTRDPRRLLQYRAKVNFFSMSWSQQENEEDTDIVFDLGAFLLTSRVIADEALDIDSNAGEAYLRTTNWTYRIPTWYLYFRKVDFKPDAEINGRWEWAGIYFGEKL